MDQREMYAEVNALLGAIAKAFDITPEQAARAVEAGEITMGMAEDERGERYLDAAYAGRKARLYQGAIRYAPEGK